MGRLFDDFGNISFRNEAEVSQNFIIPLLVNYLGYNADEIIPENNYAVRDVYSGVSFSKAGSKSIYHRPDFVICLQGDMNDPKFVIDSKGPNEDIDNHHRQLHSYSISVGINILMITNGREIKVYDVNNLLFYSEDIGDLQTKLSSLLQLLGRDIQRLKSPMDIIRDFDYKNAISLPRQIILNQEIKRKAVLLADFSDYLKDVCKGFENWHLPSRYFLALDNLDLNKIDPNHLLTFRYHNTDSKLPDREKRLTLPEIECVRSLNIKIFVGETGIGKSCLLRYLTYRSAQSCLDYRDTRIPVYISLRDISSNSTLNDLIIAFLNRNGYHCKSFYDLPKKNEFVFFLDAYDEVGEAFLYQTFTLVEYLSNAYECYLTTRPNRVPSFRPAVTIDVLSLSEFQIKEIAQFHLGGNYYRFLRQLQNNHLKVESGNILLLLLLVSLFKEFGALPSTIAEVISSIVERIQKWQDIKKQYRGQLTWEAIQDLLAVLAYRIFELGETVLSKSEVEALLMNKVIELERIRRIAPGLVIAKIIDDLAETGLLIVNNHHVFFWHRLFLNYFVSSELRNRYNDEPSILRILSKDERWHLAIVGLARLLPSTTDLLTSLQDRLFLRAYCLAENNNCDETTALQTIDELKALFHSAVPDIRLNALSLLAKIDHQQASAFFFKVIDGHYSVDVRIKSLSIIGATKSKKALTVIYRYLNWDEGDFLSGLSSQSHIAKGLSYYTEDEHLQIIKNWRKEHGYFMAETCQDIFIDLYNQKKITPKIIDSLQNLFIEEYISEYNSNDKISALSEILAHVPDLSFAKRIIELCSNGGDIIRFKASCELLKRYPIGEVIDLIKEKITNNIFKSYELECIADIITGSVYPVPKEIFYELATHQNVNVASKAISALKRFLYNDVKVEVEKHLYGEQPQLQSWALDVLVTNSEVVSLIRKELFPKHFYTPTAHTLLKAVRRFHLSEALPIMEKIFVALGKNKRYLEERHLSLDLAGTFYFMGERQRHEEIIEWFFDGSEFIQKEYDLHLNILQSLRFFDHALAFQIARCFFKTYHPAGKRSGETCMHFFLDTVEELGQQALSIFVKEIVEILIIKINNGEKDVYFDLERPMRALVQLVQSSDEEWILANIDTMKQYKGIEYSQLRRAIECLGVAGSTKSLSCIKETATQFMHNRMVLNTCQRSYKAICIRERVNYIDGDLFQS